jgi:hypothetical protein
LIRTACKLEKLEKSFGASDAKGKEQKRKPALHPQNPGTGQTVCRERSNKDQRENEKPCSQEENRAEILPGFSLL